MTVKSSICTPFGRRGSFGKKNTYSSSTSITTRISDVVPFSTNMPCTFSGINDESSTDSSTPTVVRKRMARRRRSNHFKHQKEVRQELHQLLKQVEAEDGELKKSLFRSNSFYESKSESELVLDKESAALFHYTNQEYKTQGAVSEDKERKVSSSFGSNPLSRSWHGYTDMTSYERKAMEKLSNEWKGKVVNHTFSARTTSESDTPESSSEKTADAGVSSCARCACNRTNCSMTSDVTCSSFKSQKWFSKNDLIAMAEDGDDCNNIKSSLKILDGHSSTSSSNSSSSSNDSISASSSDTVSLSSKGENQNGPREEKFLSDFNDDEEDSYDGDSVSSREEKTDEDEDEDNDSRCGSSFNEDKESSMLHSKDNTSAPEDDVSDISLELEDFDDNSDETARARDPNSSSTNLLVLGDYPGCSPAFEKSSDSFWCASSSHHTSQGESARRLFDSIIKAGDMERGGRMPHESNSFGERPSSFFGRSRVAGLWLIENAAPIMIYVCVFLWYCKVFLTENLDEEIGNDGESLSGGLRRLLLNRQA